MALALDLSVFVQHDGDGASHMELVVEGIVDAASLRAIEIAVCKLPGISRARVNFTDRRLFVEWTDHAFDPARILDELAGLGYPAHPFSLHIAVETEAAQMRWLLRCLAVAAFAAMNIMLLSVAVWAGNVSDMTVETRDFFHWLSALIVIPAAAFAGQPFFRSAIRAVRAGSLNMDVPISLGILLALSMSVVETGHHAEHAYFDSAIMLIAFLLAGRYLDHAMRRKTRVFAANLSALRAPTASRIGSNGELTVVPAAALMAGDVVLVGAGERIPVDGIIVSGSSEIDQSLVTGETSCTVVSAGSNVYAGTLNCNGALQIRALAVVGGTLLDDIARLMESASLQKTRYLRLAERAARLYAPVVHATAILAAIGWLLAGASAHDAIVIAITVLIITCPCALALAVPAVQVVATGALFRSSVLINAGDAIERLADIDTVVFDKTGTLTLPEPQIDNVGHVAPQTVEIAARLALSSHHPLARALAALGIDHTPFEECHEVPGEGVRAIIDGVEARLGNPVFCNLEFEANCAHNSHEEASVIAFRHGIASAVFVVHQKLRPDALPVVEGLRSRGLATMILSGDSAPAVKACADALGITGWRAQMKPADKVACLAELKEQGRKVLMVGDGMNDAPALASAYVSLSPITASGITQAAADALFLGDRLAPVAAAIEIACRAKTLMRQNLWFAVLYNSVAVPLAMLGLVTPLIAAAAMSGSSVIVTLNALRARRAGHVRKAASLEPMLISTRSPHHLNEALP